MPTTLEKLTTVVAPSTNYSSSYLLPNYMHPVELLEEDYDESVDLFLDIYDHKLFSFLNTVTRWYYHRWDGTKKITTLAYETYGNTTVWWIIPLFNGYTHYLEIPYGTILRIPDISGMYSYVNTLKPTGTKIITI